MAPGHQCSDSEPESEPDEDASQSGGEGNSGSEGTDSEEGYDHEHYDEYDYDDEEDDSDSDSATLDGLTPGDYEDFYDLGFSRREKHGDDGDEDDMDVSEEEELPLVDNPSSDIRDELIDTLKDFHGTFGTFFSSHSFSEDVAPNPKISIEEFGKLELPLSVASAKRLVAASVTKQAPFGKGERTVVDKAVRDTWEVDGSKVKFVNAYWNTWMKTVVVPQVCHDLGVDLAESSPRAELYKLLLYEKGSHFLPHQDTEKSPGMFATIVIVLPSKFSGGSLHLTHAGKSQIIDIAANSPSMTHALAWYTDVFHSVQPVKSGYRLALSYNLIHTQSKSDIPKPRMLSEKTGRLEKVLLTWKQAKEGRLNLERSVPQQLCYLLDHKYSKVNLDSVALKGKDAGLVARVTPVAMELNFGLYIANIQLLKSGTADDDFGWNSRRSSVKFTEPPDESLSFLHIVDPDGNSLSKSKAPISMKQVIPRRFGRNEKADGRDYEGYQGNGAGSLEYWYHRTVLVFFPDKFFFGRGNVVEYACRKLSKCTSTEPRLKEKKLANRLIVEFSEENVLGKYIKQGVTVLSDVSTRWKDLDIWTRAIQACPSILILETLGVERIVSAYQTFGFHSIKTQLTEVIHGDESNSRRVGLVQELSRLGNEKEDTPLMKWCSSQIDFILNTLKKAENQDIEFLVDTVKKRKAHVLTEIIFPQLSNNQTPISFWTTFLPRLIKEKSAIPPSPDEVELAVANQASNIMSTVSPFPTHKVSQQRWEEGKLQPNLDNWILYIKLCFQLKIQDECSAYFKSMRDAYDTKSEEEKDWIADNFIGPAIVRLDREAQAYSPKLSSVLGIFFKFALDVYVKRAVLQSKGNFDAATYMIATARSGGAGYLKSTLDANYNHLVKNRPSEAQKLLSLLVEGKTRMSKEHPDRPIYRDLIANILGSIIRATGLEASAPSYRGYGYGRTSSCDELPGLKLIKLCHETGHNKKITSILQSVLVPKRNVDERDQIIYGLVPLLPQLGTYLTSVNLSIADEPYAGFAAIAIDRYLKVILGKKLDEEVFKSRIRSIGCGCGDCKDLRNSLFNGDRVIEFKKVQRVRSHLEYELRKTERWGVTWVTIHSGSPHTLEITKPPEFVRPDEWVRKRGDALRFVKSIGPVETLRKILGAQFDEVINLVGLRTNPPASGPSSGIPHRQATTKRTLPSNQIPDAKRRKVLR